MTVVDRGVSRLGVYRNLPLLRPVPTGSHDGNGNGDNSDPMA